MHVDQNEQMVVPNTRDAPSCGRLGEIGSRAEVLYSDSACEA
jgi:hypothetical protein